MRKHAEKIGGNIMKPILAAMIVLVTLFSSDRSLAGPNDDCPKTLGSSKFLGPLFPESESWYGSEALAVVLPSNGMWPTTGDRARIAVKLFWWSSGFKPGMESNLSIKIDNLSGGPNDAVASSPTNAHSDSLGGWTMLVGIDFPSLGCWQIAAEFLGQSLTFVVETVDDETYLRGAT